MACSRLVAAHSEQVEGFSSPAIDTMRGKALQIGENVRYPDGGNFPEWLFETYGKRTCVITLEYKKIFMDEWTGTLDIGAAQDLRTGLMHALAVARTELARLNR